MTIIYPGSFDPIHNGHLNLALKVSNAIGVEEVILLPSRQNPLKTHGTLASDIDRFNMISAAIEGKKKLNVSNLELTLPWPSYTINTLQELRRLYPAKDFRLLIGADNWLLFKRWKEAEKIVAEFGLVIYPRPGYAIKETDSWISTHNSHILILSQAPRFSFSSTDVRLRLSQGLSVEEMIPEAVAKYINAKNLYKYDTHTGNDARRRY